MSEGFGRRAAIAVLVALFGALLVLVVTADGPDAVSGGLGGDYASFYAAGDLVRRDVGMDAERFYDPEAQFRSQESVLPSDTDGNLYFAYPAFAIGPYVPLATLGFRLSYLVHTLLMTGTVVGALVLLRPLSRTVREHQVETIAVALTFFPLFRGVTGGQNTGFSLLVIALIWRWLARGHQAPAGVAAALLLFKPPLALPFLGSLLVARRFRALVAAGMTSIALYGIGALLTDPTWPGAWVDALRYLDRADTPFNVHNFVSVPGAAEAVFGIDSTAAILVGGALSVVAVCITAWSWFRDVGGLDGRIALTISCALLVSPHALYYDAGLLVIVGLVLVDRRPGLRPWVAVGWIAGLSHLAAESLGWSPVVLLVLSAFVASAKLVRDQQRCRSGGTDRDGAVGASTQVARGGLAC